MNFHLKSPFSYRYNCIAFALGMTDRWVDHLELPWHWWPPVEKGPSVEHLKNAFRYFGFEECGLDDRVDPLYDKIAIYNIGDDWTHAARIISNGIYHSKFGESYDGLHSSGSVLKLRYGNVSVIMRRLKTDAHLTETRKGIPPGVVHLNIKVNIGGVENHLVSFNGKTYLEGFGKEVRILEDGKIGLL